MKANTRGHSIIAAILATLSCSHPTVHAQGVAEREVSFLNGTVELRGTLMLPPGTGPFPAVVFLHGSGPATREGARPYAEEFAKLGVASLFFDKRGSGGSGGSWITSSLDDLAGDALAAVRRLKAEEVIDPTRVGFWGVSQAGWVATAAASNSTEVAFMIIISGGGASPRESELFSYELEFERAGLSQGEIGEARELLDDYFDYLQGADGRPELVSRLESLRGGRLAPLADELLPVLPSEENRSNWSWVASYDPSADMASLEFPLLLLFGDRDTDHPTSLAAERWRDSAREAGNENVTIVVFPNAGHGIRIRDGASGAARGFAAGYMEVMLGWLWLHIVSPS